MGRVRWKTALPQSDVYHKAIETIGGLCQFSAGELNRRGTICGLWELALSTSETVEFEVGKCPCGNGAIVKSVTTQDNPWSSADISYSISCTTCSSEWILEYGSLSSRTESNALRAAENEQRKVEKEIRSMVAPLVDHHFFQLGLPTMAAEHRELLRLGITTGDVRQYRKSRSAGGKKISEICMPTRNQAWIETLISSAGKSKQYQEAVKCLNQAKAKCREAASKVKRFPIPK